MEFQLNIFKTRQTYYKMDVFKVSKKLQPIMPNKVSSLMKSRELADPDLKALIEKQIISMAYKTFGDFRNKILLSLPPENKSKGQINIGTIVYDKEKWPFGIDRKSVV